MTSAPLRAAATAADTPAEPPPTTKTSVSALTGVERGSSSMKRCPLCIMPSPQPSPARGRGSDKQHARPFLGSFSLWERARVRVVPLPHLFQQPQQRLLPALLPVPHGALFNHGMGHGWEFAFLGADIT